MQRLPGRILVVDDHATNRLKMSLAVKALGHGAETAEDGVRALARLREDDFDLVLLDIMMPEMDGFAVLAEMKADKDLRDIPGIVISSLEDDMASVVKAIELGAEDFLPKNFDPVLLRARVNACLEKKRLRDREIEYLHQVAKLTDAAAVLEAGNFNPARLGLQTVATREDALGRLARVFVDMAQQVYERERALQRHVRTLKGSLVLLAVGALWGLIAPLARMAAGIDAHPIGLALWVNVLGALTCLSIAIARGTLPRFSRPLALFIAIWAVFGGVGTEVLVYTVAEKLPASIISILIVLEGFIVFAFAAAMRIERPNLKRLAGLALGLCAMLLILLPAGGTGGLGDWTWVAIALGVPLVYAIEDILLAGKALDGVDRVAAIGLMMAASAIILAPLALAFGDFLPLGMPLGRLEAVVLLIAAATTVGGLLFVYLVSTTGAVFASQNAYAVTLAGIGWSMLLLGERLSLWAWAALALMVVGLILVEPKNEAEELPPLVLEAGT